MNHLLLPFLLLALAPAAFAQTCEYNCGTEPLQLSGNTAALLPAGGPGLFYRKHVMVPALVFQNVPLVITDVSVSCPAGYRQLSFSRLTIRMGHTTVAQLSNTFAQNITSPLQTVLDARDHVFFEGFGPAWVPLGLQVPFQFHPGSGNLLIEVVVEGGVVLGSFTFNYPGGSPFGACVTSAAETTLPVLGGPDSIPRLRLCSDRAEVILFGQNCTGSGSSTPLLGVGGMPTPGATATIWLSDAPPNALAVCAYGFDTQPPFPLNLTPLGAPGCRQYFGLALYDVVVANNQGIGQRTILVPSASSTIGAIVYAQYFVLDPPANPLGITTSNYARLLVGL
jgi:hypothetical protein